ncbi:MAG TPA: hypothetical protein VKB93_01065 [Thermoanaerobaculia bacterium]|nr:hypothetical protein [Thermoanaerobaculia bacterium]
MSLVELQRPTISYVYQADLSDALPGFEYTLCAYNSEVALVAHTAGTRAAARAADPSLQAIPDEQLTHFSPPVEVPFDAACRVHIAGTPSDRSRPSYVHVAAITIPPPERPRAAVFQTIDYVSTARAFLFHHPDLISVTISLSTIVREHMTLDVQAAAAIAALALEMKRQGPPTEKKDEGWAQLVPFKDVQGVEHFLQQPSTKTVEAARAAMGRIQLTTKNDLRLKDRKWTQEQGFSVVTEEIGPLTSGEVTIKPDIATRLHGLRTFVEPPKKPGMGLRTRLRMENYDLRFLGAYIQFIDIDGKAMSTPDWKPDGSPGAPSYIDQQDDLRWLDGLGSTDTIFGVPNPGVPGSIDHDITFPEGAVAARLYTLGLGTGRNPFKGPTLYAAVRTAMVNLAIPALLLPAGVAVTKYQRLKEIFDSKEVGIVAATIGLAYAEYVGIGSAVDGKVNWGGLSTIGQFIFSKGLELVAAFVGGLVLEGTLKRNIPFAGWVMAAIDVAVGIAQITQTIVSVATSPWAIENRLATTIRSIVTVKPDPARGAFPDADAGEPRFLNVRLIYQSDQPTQSVTVQVLPGSVEIEVQFTNNLGGRVKFQADFLVGSEVAASASTDWLANDGRKTGDVTLLLFQKRIELTKDTEYEHAALLTYQNGAYQWMPTNAAPVTTRLNLSLDDKDNAISKLVGVSLSQRHRQLGYSWRAFGLGIGNCAGGTQETHLSALQSVNIPGLPMDDARFSGCGYSPLANIVYDTFPPRFELTEDGKQYKVDDQGRPIPDPESRDLGLYYVDPLPGNRPAEQGGGYHLRKIPNRGRAPINGGGEPPRSYGRFPLAVDSLVIHPSGRVLAINNRLSELMITTLEDAEGQRDDDLPFARRVAGPAMDYKPPDGPPTLRRRAGLLANPIAVASTYDGTVIVLESIDLLPQVSRLQAFDGNGNPVNAFRETSGTFGPFLDLPTGRHYLSLAVAGNDDLTDIFILYYTGDGEVPEEYRVDVYQIGARIPPERGSFLLTAPRISAAALAVDLFRTLYTLNWSMTTDGKGNLAGPRIGPTGPAGRTVPALSQWRPRRKGPQ